MNNPKIHTEEQVGLTLPKNDDTDEEGRAMPPVDVRARVEGQAVTVLDAPAVNFETEAQDGAGEAQAQGEDVIRSDARSQNATVEQRPAKRRDA